MTTPDWIETVLSAFDGKTEPHSAIEVAEALEIAAANHGQQTDEDAKVYRAEHSAFLLRGVHEKAESIWGTYFGPWAVITSSGYISPDISKLDAETLEYWQQRANEARDPVMIARYADASWDLAKTIAGAKPNHLMARLASDAYVSAADRRLCTLPFFAVHWLVRALALARSVKDETRTSQAIGSMFAFYEANLSPKLVGVWLTLVEHLYSAQELLTEEQIKRMVSDMENMLVTLSTPDENNRFDSFNAQAVGEKLVQHYKTVGDVNSVARVIRTFGGAFEKMAEGSSAMLASGWLQPIIERYEQEGMKADAEALQNKLQQQYGNAADELKTISISHTITNEEIEDLLRALVVEGDLSTTLNRVAFYFLPKVEQARSLVEQAKTVAPFMSMIPVSIVDDKGRTKARIGTDEDVEGHLYYQLNQTMTFYEPYLYIVLSKIKERFTLSADDLLSFLYECPIFPESRRPILREGLKAYVDGDFLKAIHVLIPQVEESLRNFLVLIGIPPVKSMPRHPGITDVKSMNNVLEEERVKEVLPEDVWRYLTLLYIDRRGLNLRNDLAHGLIPLEGFNEAVANRVLHSLLILSPIRVVQNKEASHHDQ
jgi:hypothetical protein